MTAAAVILPLNFENKILNDSKQLSHKKRALLRPLIETEAVSFGVTHVFQEEIDTINILNASILAMHRSIEQLKPIPEFIAVDGNKFKPFNNIPHETIVKGDGKYLNIASRCSSFIAKNDNKLSETYDLDLIQKVSILFH